MQYCKIYGDNVKPLSYNILRLFLNPIRILEVAKKLLKCNNYLGLVLKKKNVEKCRIKCEILVLLKAFYKLFL